MPRRRPGSVTAAAVLAIIYGSVFTFCGLCGIAGLAMQSANPFVKADPQQAQLQKQLEEAMQREVPGYKVQQIAGPVLGLMFAMAMLAAGVGLLGMYSWARLLAIIDASVIILFNCVQTVYAAVFTFPAINRVFTNVLPNVMKAQAKGARMPPGFEEGMRIAMMGVVGLAVLVQVAVIVYLLVLIVLLLRSNVRAAFASGTDTASERERPERADDEGWGASAPPRKNDDFRIQ